MMPEAQYGTYKKEDTGIQDSQPATTLTLQPLQSLQGLQNVQSVQSTQAVQAPYPHPTRPVARQLWGDGDVSHQSAYLADAPFQRQAALRQDGRKMLLQGKRPATTHGGILQRQQSEAYAKRQGYAKGRATSKGRRHTMPMTIDQLHEHRMQYYRHPISNVLSHNRVSIYHLWTYITNPLLYKQATDTLRGIADEKERKAFKAKEFDYILASGTFSSRNDQGLIQHSSLLCIDIDHIGYEQVEDLKQQFIHDEVMKENFELELAFRSPSGDGLKLIVAIDLQEADHATWFLALQNYIRLNYGVDIDPACKNVSRACFLPYDRHCYVNPLICPF